MREFEECHQRFRLWRVANNVKCLVPLLRLEQESYEPLDGLLVLCPRGLLSPEECSEQGVE
jgi:hypothetical protein